jgi:methionine sulfoxide reductase heme-binding subunit
LRHPLKVWRDPSDRMSALRIVTLICLFAPLCKTIYDFDAIRLDPRPITDLIHRTGDWALIFLLIALTATPLSRILRFNQLLDVRRMIGVGAFAYAAAHSCGTGENLGARGSWLPRLRRPIATHSSRRLPISI